MRRTDWKTHRLPEKCAVCNGAIPGCQGHKGRKRRGFSPFWRPRRRACPPAIRCRRKVAGAVLARKVCCGARSPGAGVVAAAVCGRRADQITPDAQRGSAARMTRMPGTGPGMTGIARFVMAGPGPAIHVLSQGSSPRRIRSAAREPPGSLTAATSSRHCEIMKNITVSVHDDTCRLARIKAAERDTSVSALVKQYLVALARDESIFDRPVREEVELRARIKDFSAADNPPRDSLYRRGE